MPSYFARRAPSPIRVWVADLVTGANGYVGSRLVTACCEPTPGAGRTRNPKLSSARLVDQVVRSSRRVSPCRRGPLYASFRDAAGLDVCIPGHGIAQTGSATPTRTRPRTWRPRPGGDAGVRASSTCGGFVPDDRGVSDHLASRPRWRRPNGEAGPELCGLARRRSSAPVRGRSRLLRYVGERFPLMSRRDGWKPIDPIPSRRAALLVAAADPAKSVGAYELGPEPSYPGCCQSSAHLRSRGTPR